MRTTPSSPARGPDDPFVVVGLRGPRLVAYTAAAVVVGAAVTLFVPRPADRHVADEARARAAADVAHEARLDMLEAVVFKAPTTTPDLPATETILEDLPAISATSLFAWWRLDGDGKDETGRHPLTNQNPNGFGIGLRGSAMRGKGNSKGMSASLTGLDMNRDFTIAMWAMRDTSVYDNDALLDNTALYLAKRDAWGGRIGVFLNGDVDKPFAALVDDSPLQNQGQGRWVHVLLFRRGNLVSLRVNGKGTATVDVRGQTFAPVTDVLLGVQRHGYPWQGRIDDVTVWSRALEVPEIASLVAGAQPALGSPGPR